MREVYLLILTTMITSFVGSGGIIGLIFVGLKRSWENKLKEKEQLAIKQEQRKIKRNQLDNDLRHAQGILMFWLYKAVVSGNHNGELEEAFSNYQTTSANIKAFETQILAEMREDE